MTLSLARTTNSRPVPIRYRCGSCTKLHKGLPELTFAAPDLYATLSAEARESKARVGSDFCVIDDAGCFIRAALDMPIAGHDERFAFGVWARVGLLDFRAYFQEFGTSNRQPLPAFAGEFGHDLPGYEATLRLPCTLVPRSGGERPRLVFADIAHPIGADQRDGMSLVQAIRVVQAARIGAMVVVG